MRLAEKVVEADSCNLDVGRCQVRSRGGNVFFVKEDDVVYGNPGRLRRDPASPASESSKSVPVGEPPTPEGWPKTIWICEKCGEQPGGVNLPCACTGWDGKRVEVRVAPVGEPDEQKTINGLLDAVERLNGQKDALRVENEQLRELLDLPVGERVAAVAELAWGADDERLKATIFDEVENLIGALLEILPVEGSWSGGFAVSERVGSQVVALPEEWATAAHHLCEVHRRLVAEGGDQREITLDVEKIVERVGLHPDRVQDVLDEAVERAYGVEGE